MIRVEILNPGIFYYDLMIVNKLPLEILKNDNKMIIFIVIVMLVL